MKGGGESMTAVGAGGGGSVTPPAKHIIASSVSSICGIVAPSLNERPQWFSHEHPGLQLPQQQLEPQRSFPEWLTTCVRGPHLRRYGKEKWTPPFFDDAFAHAAQAGPCSCNDG